MAIENPLITADVIEIEEFPSLAQTYAVRGVPKTVLSASTQGCQLISTKPVCRGGPRSRVR